LPQSEAGFGSTLLRERSYDLALSLLPEANTFTPFFCFAGHYALDPLNNLFDLVMKVDVSMHFHFQVQAILINRKNTLEQMTLVSGGDQRTFCSIIFTIMFRGDDRIIFRRPNLLFRITTAGVGRQLLIQNGPLSCKLVLLSSTYMENCIIASTNISPLLGLCTGHLKATGKVKSPVRSQILSSSILFKEVTTTKTHAHWMTF